jgi:Ulp1 family protease
MLKYKTNGVKLQSVNSPDCGFFAMDFILKRSEGVPFDKATGFEGSESNVSFGEKEVEKVKHYFGYL